MYQIHLLFVKVKNDLHSFHRDGKLFILSYILLIILLIIKYQKWVDFIKKYIKITYVILTYKIYQRRKKYLVKWC